MRTCPHPPCARCDRREGEYGPYWRYQSKELNDLMWNSQHVGGRPRRNVCVGTIPEVKAHDGHLEEGMSGIEFHTLVRPNKNHVPCEPTWSGTRPGIIHPKDDPDLVLIAARIVKRVD